MEAQPTEAQPTEAQPTEAHPAAAQPAARSVESVATHAEPDPGPDPSPSADTPADAGEDPPRRRLGRRAARRSNEATAPAGDHERQAALAALRSESDPRRRPRAVPPTTDEEGGLPYVVEFTPRRGPQLLVTGVLLACLASTGVVGWIAYQDRTQAVVATAAALATLTAFVWAVRAGTSPTRMTVTGGRLEIRRSGGRHVFDLTSPALSIEERGRPGQRGWKVIFVRRGLGPYVVDTSMVDPHDFSRVLDFYRPRS